MSILKNWCRHHSSEGLARKCALGIDIRKHVGGASFGWGNRFPCYAKNRENAGHVPCDKWEGYTAQEQADDDAAMERSKRRLVATIPLFFRVKREHKGKNWRGVEECPNCKGRLHLSHAAFNGHVSGKCETASCMTFME